MCSLSRYYCSLLRPFNQRISCYVPLHGIGFRHLSRHTNQIKASQRKSMPVAYISLGANYGGIERIHTIENAISRIRGKIGTLDACSCLYESLPGYDVDPRSKHEHDMYMPLHLNAVIRVQTNIADPQDILNALHRIEAEHKRDRSPNASRLHRTLDLDLLFFENAHAESVKINTETLTLPHPRLAQRNFILFPLCDIDPNLAHPTEGSTVRDLLVLNLQRRAKILLNSVKNGCPALEGPASEGIPVYTLDGNVAVPRRCFAPNDHQLWTVKNSGPAVGDTLRWIREVMRRRNFDKNRPDHTEPPSLDSLRALERSLTNEPRTPRLMGVLNVTADSFSDGNKYNTSVDAAVEHARNMVEAGAEIIDIGGEATNPFVQNEVSVEEEMRRVLPVIETIRKHNYVGAIISVDTRRKPVAEAAAASGADMINDVTAGDSDPNLLSFVASRGLPIVIMHSRGLPRTMDDAVRYDNLIKDVAQYLTEKATSLMQLGLPRWRLIIDAGLGFSKTPEQCFELLRRLGDLQANVPSGIPVLVGHSRKRFIGSAINESRYVRQKTQEPGQQNRVSEDAEMANRDIAGIAIACWSARNYVDILRVHDVKKTALAFAVMEKLTGQTPSVEADVDIRRLFSVSCNPQRN